METRVIMQNSHNENIMDKVHKHMSANVECTNVEIKMQNIFFSATQQQVSRGSRGTIDAFFGKTIVSRFLQPSDLYLLGGLWIVAQTQLGWDHYVAFIYHSLVEGRQPFGYITQHNKQTIFAQKGCDHPVATKHKFFLRKAWYD